jgi:hypothetical protein
MDPPVQLHIARDPLSIAFDNVVAEDLEKQSDCSSLHQPDPYAAVERRQRCDFGLSNIVTDGNFLKTKLPLQKSYHRLLPWSTDGNLLKTKLW